MTDALPDLSAVLKALERVSMLPGSAQKRARNDFVQIGAQNLSPAQRDYVLKLAYRYRRQMPAHLVPPASIMKPPTGPVRVVARQAAVCPAGVIWCGPDSPWDNPWRAKGGGTVRALARFYGWCRDSSNKTSSSYGHLPAAHRCEAERILFDAWLGGTLAELPANVRAGALAMTDPDLTDMVRIPPPWPRSEIVAHLSGRPLADKTARRYASHVDTLLRIANET